MTGQRNRLADGDTMDASRTREKAGSTIQQGRTTEQSRHDDGGATLSRMSEQLADYLDRQIGVTQLRDREMPNFPWPGRDNPMLTYLVHRAEEMAITNGRPAATIWLAVHAWFEGAIEALATNAARSKAPLRRGIPSHTLPNQDEK
jgi:hypothetical protein